MCMDSAVTLISWQCFVVQYSQIGHNPIPISRTFNNAIENVDKSK